MRLAGLIFVLVCVCVSFVFAQNDNPFPNVPLPPLPSSFSVMVELNNLYTNSTTYTFGYYDYDKQRFRIEEHTQEKSIVTIVLVEQRTSYVLVVGTSDCVTKNDIVNIDLISGDFFLFSQTLDYNFTGPDNARGIITDGWNASHSGQDPTYPDLTSTFTLHYQFSASEWNMHAGQKSEFRVPVKASLDGFSELDGTQLPLSRQYNFMDFFYGNLSDSLFAQPYACMTKPPTYSKSQAFTAGGIAGVVVAGIIIIAAVVGRVIYLRRNPINKGHRLADDAVM